jgi:hypothetical protein
MTEPFDIDEIESAETGELAIVHPATGEPTTWVWTLAGPGHPKAVEAANIAAREGLRIARLREQAQANRKKWIEPERSPDEMRLDNAKSFAIRVLGWTPVRMNGADYAYSQENVIKLLLNPAYGRIYTQLLDYFTSDESFTKRSATISPDSQSETSS